MNQITEHVMNPDHVKRILKDKRILWVDDRWEQIQPFIDELVDNEYISEEQMQVAFDLSSALDYLKDKNHLPDMVLIDLNIASMPDELITLRKQHFQTETLNHGQSLGVWLSQNRPQLKYAYLSALVEHFDTQAHSSQADALVLGKNFEVMDFPGWLALALQPKSA